MNRNAEVIMSLGIVPVQDRIAVAEDVLDTLYDQHARALFHYALALTGSPEDAEDAVQEVFVGLARQKKQIHRIDNIRGYLLKATRNAAYTILRSRQRRGVLEKSLADDIRSEDPHRREESSFEGTILRESFALLPLEQREVLALKVFQGMTFREIAQILGISINTAASRYRYGIEKLREALEGDR